MTHTSGHRDTAWFKSRTNWALIVFLLIAGFFLFTEHRAHFLGVLPLLLLLACPLLHVFMHGGHGHGGHDHSPGSRSDGGER